MNIYTVDKIKETLIKSNPLWQKQISVTGTFLDENNGSYYLVSDETDTKIKIDDDFLPQDHYLENGDVVTLKGYLNYSGYGQKSKGSKDDKIGRIFFTKSYLSFSFYPTEVNDVRKKESNTIYFTENNTKDSIVKEYASNILIFIILVIIFTLLIYILNR